MGIDLAVIVFPVHSEVSDWLLLAVCATTVLVATKGIHWALGTVGRITHHAYIRFAQNSNVPTTVESTIKISRL